MSGLFEPIHLMILAIVILVLFGAKKIPEFMRGLGQGMGELQKGLNDAKSKMNMSMDQEPHNPPAVNPPSIQPAAAAQLPAPVEDKTSV